MDNKRLIIAMALAFGLMFGWQMLSNKMGWTPQPQPVAEQPAPAPAPAQEPAAPQASPAPVTTIPALASSGKDVTVDTPLYTAVFNSHGGVLTSFTLKQYQGTDLESLLPSGKPVEIVSGQAGKSGNLGLIINNRPTWMQGENTAQWAEPESEYLQPKGTGSNLVFTGVIGDVVITRTFSFNPDTYVLSEKLELTSNNPLLAAVSKKFSTGEMFGPEDYTKATRIAILQNGSFTETDSQKDMQAGINFGDHVSWAGTMGSYFLAAVMPADQSSGLRGKYEDGLYNIYIDKNDIPLSSGHSYTSETSYYFGPKRAADIEAAPVDLSGSMAYGWFGWIAAPLMLMLKWFYGYVGNWGVAIILLTVVIKIVLWPLSYKSYKSMENMKKLQPLMTKIREKYKDDKQRQNQEVMQLYKTYKINPMGGCLPILVQMPVFFGLYRALLSSIELRQAGFIDHVPFTDIVWLADLSLKDPLYITPIVMGLTMLLQQKMTPTTGDPTQAKVMMLMPVVFTFFFVSFPSGMVVYWLFNNIISIAQQQGQMRLSSRKAAKNTQR